MKLSMRWELTDVKRVIIDAPLAGKGKVEIIYEADGLTHRYQVKGYVGEVASGMPTHAHRK